GVEPPSVRPSRRGHQAHAASRPRHPRRAVTQLPRADSADQASAWVRRICREPNLDLTIRPRIAERVGGATLAMPSGMLATTFSATLVGMTAELVRVEA